MPSAILRGWSAAWVRRTVSCVQITHDSFFSCLFFLVFFSFRFHVPPPMDPLPGPVKADFGQTKFGQSIFGQSIFGQSIFFCVVVVGFGVESVLCCLFLLVCCVCVAVWCVCCCVLFCVVAVCFCVVVLLLMLCVCGECVQGLSAGPPPPGPPKISLFFPLPPQFSFFLPSFGVFSWNFGGVLRPGPLKCGVLGLSTQQPESP